MRIKDETPVCRVPCFYKILCPSSSYLIRLAYWSDTPYTKGPLHHGTENRPYTSLGLALLAWFPSLCGDTLSPLLAVAPLDRLTVALLWLCAVRLSPYQMG